MAVCRSAWPSTSWAGPGATSNVRLSWLQCQLKWSAKMMKGFFYHLIGCRLCLRNSLPKEWFEAHQTLQVVFVCWTVTESHSTISRRKTWKQSIKHGALSNTFWKWHTLKFLGTSSWLCSWFHRPWNHWNMGNARKVGMMTVSSEEALSGG